MFKFSATKMIKLLREGKLSLEAAGEAAKKLNLNTRTISELGRGAEGIAEKAIGARFTDTGFGVMKTYNPTGMLYSDQQFLAKSKAWEALGKDKRFAKYYGKHDTRPTTYHELIVGDKRDSFLDKRAIIPAFLTGAKARLHGFRIGDTFINPGNVINTASGPKVIDFLVRGRPQVGMMSRKEAVKALFSTDPIARFGSLILNRARGVVTAGGDIRKLNNAKVVDPSAFNKVDRVMGAIGAHKAPLIVGGTTGAIIMQNKK